MDVAFSCAFDPQKGCRLDSGNLALRAATFRREPRIRAPGLTTCRDPVFVCVKVFRMASLAAASLRDRRSLGNFLAHVGLKAASRPSRGIM